MTDIRIITDRHTRRSKGIAYIEFSKQENVFTALAMTGQVFMGQAVMVKTAEAEKNVAWEAAQAAKANQSDAAALLQAAGLAVPPVAGAAPAGGGDDIVFVPIGPPVTLRVSGFPVGLGEAELRQVFQPFGQVSDVTMVKDAAGNESSADIVFSRAVEGQAAAAHWNGNVLIGGVLSVTVVGEPEPAVAALPPLPAAPGVAAMTAAMTGADVGELDEQEGGFKLNSVSRAALMSRLAGGADALPPAVAPAVAAAAAGGAPALVVAAGAPNVPPAVLMAQSALGPPSPIPTQCITLKNVWRGEQTAEPGWDSEVMDDMKDEASKCGQLLHVHLDPSSQVRRARRGQRAAWLASLLAALHAACMHCCHAMQLATLLHRRFMLCAKNPLHKPRNALAEAPHPAPTPNRARPAPRPRPSPPGLCVHEVCNARERGRGAQTDEQPVLHGQHDHRRVPVCAALQRPLRPRVTARAGPSRTPLGAPRPRARPACEAHAPARPCRLADRAAARCRERERSRRTLILAAPGDSSWRAACGWRSGGGPTSAAQALRSGGWRWRQLELTHRPFLQVDRPSCGTLVPVWPGPWLHARFSFHTGLATAERLASSWHRFQVSPPNAGCRARGGERACRLCALMHAGTRPSLHRSRLPLANLHLRAAHPAGSPWFGVGWSGSRPFGAAAFASTALPSLVPHRPRSPPPGAQTRSPYREAF